MLTRMEYVGFFQGSLGLTQQGDLRVRVSHRVQGLGFRVRFRV